MAIFRKVHTAIWSDSFFSELDKDKKLFYLYLLTNERTTQCGVYEITKRQMSFDTGYTIDRVSILLKHFIKCGKIRYNATTFEVAIGNWMKYNNSSSPKVQSCINKEFKNVKDTLLIEYVKSIDTASQEEQEKEEEEEENKKPKFTPPTLLEVESYFNEWGFKGAKKAFDYYEAANWHDAKGDKIKSWKQKMQGVWFKDENKIAVKDQMCIMTSTHTNMGREMTKPYSYYLKELSWSDKDNVKLIKLL